MSRAKLLREALLAHGVTAVLHHDDLVVVALHVRERLRQDAGDVGGKSHRGNGSAVSAEAP